MKELIIIGAGGHGKVVADIAINIGYESVKFLDDNERIEYCGSFAVVGRSWEVERYDCDIFVAIGNAEIRQRIQKRLEEDNKKIPVLIHPKAVVARDIEIGNGSVVMAGTVINSGSRIGKGCIVNTCSSVDHDCKIMDYVHISVGAHVAGTVNIGCRTWIGAGAVISNNLAIAGDCIIGAGAAVVRNIEEKGCYAGVPAKKIK